MITGGTSSAVAVALNKLAQREKVLFVCGISGSNDTTGKDCVRYGFRQNFYGQTAAAAIGPIMKVCRDLAASGQTIVLVEQNLAATLALAQRTYIINNGHIVHEGPAHEIRAQPDILQRYLGV